MEQRSGEGNSLEMQCPYCGSEGGNPLQGERPEHYQVVVTCAQCGNDFAAFSRN